MMNDKREQLKIMLCKKNDYSPVNSLDNNLISTNLKDKYKYIVKNKEVTDKELGECIDTILTYMANREFEMICIDLEARDKSKAPPKDITIEEIEKELGYKIKIVKENKK